MLSISKSLSFFFPWRNQNNLLNLIFPVFNPFCRVKIWRKNLVVISTSD